VRAIDIYGDNLSAANNTQENNAKDKESQGA